MGKHKQIFTFLFLIFLSADVSGGSSDRHPRKYLTKIFVFGDSYGDTGNTRKAFTNAWKEPYGSSFPGKPTGRFSDGRVLTDYIARFLDLKSPIPYNRRESAPSRWHNGMNFAHGGTGVFDTIYLGPNMTTQIDFFEKLINGSSYTKQDLKSSLGLLVLSGNDYASYLAKGGSFKDLPSFIKLVVNQLVVNLKRLRGMGVRKVAMTALQPIGCLPRSTIANSFNKCIEKVNSLVKFHNQLLRGEISKLNNEIKGSPFLVLDLYGSFIVGLARKGLKQDDSAFSAYISKGKSRNRLKPCCMGISSKYSCSSLHQNGTKMYTVCSDPKSAFFWDMVHPTQAGWHKVYLALKPYLEQNIKLN